MANSVQMMIQAGQKKLDRGKWKEKRVEARQNERDERAKRAILAMYPGIAEFIRFHGGFRDLSASIPGFRFAIEAPRCVAFEGRVFFDEKGMLCRTGPGGEWPSFYNFNPSGFDIATNDLDVALALANQKWLEINGNEAVYGALEDGA